MTFKKGTLRTILSEWTIQELRAICDDPLQTREAPTSEHHPARPGRSSARLPQVLSTFGQKDFMAELDRGEHLAALDQIGVCFKDGVDFGERLAELKLVPAHAGIF